MCCYMSMLGNAAECNQNPHTDHVPTCQTLTDFMATGTD